MSVVIALEYEDVSLEMTLHVKHCGSLPKHLKSYFINVLMFAFE